MQALQEIEPVFPAEEFRHETPLPRTKFNISMEKKIERLWYESRQHGWSFGRFVTAILEVLTILHHRNKLDQFDRAPRKSLRRRAALS